MEAIIHSRWNQIIQNPIIKISFDMNGNLKVCDTFIGTVTLRYYFFIVWSMNGLSHCFTCFNLHFFFLHEVNIKSFFFSIFYVLHCSFDNAFLKRKMNVMVQFQKLVGLRISGAAICENGMFSMFFYNIRKKMFRYNKRISLF